MKLIDAALYYSSCGMSIIPIGQNKLPNWDCMPREMDDRTGTLRPSWKEFQTRRATEDELRLWFSKAKTTGLAVVCGSVSGSLLCFDFDSDDFFKKWLQLLGGREKLKQAFIQKTSRGYQVLIRTVNPGRNEPLAFVADTTEHKGMRPVIETRAEGGYCLLPPSLHPSGHIYASFPGYDSCEELLFLSPEEVNTWKELACSLNEVQQTEKAKRNREDSQLSKAALIIDEFCKRHVVTEYLDRFGYAHMRGEGYHRPDGRKQSVYVYELEGKEVSFHFNTGDSVEGVSLYGKPHDAFDWFKMTECGNDLMVALERAAGEVGIHWDVAGELTQPAIETKPVFHTGEGETVVLTDSPALVDLLLKHNIPVLAGPSSCWPREWVSYVNDYRNRFVAFSGEDAEATALEMEAKWIEVPDGLSNFLATKKTIQEFASMLRLCAKEPVY